MIAAPKAASEGRFWQENRRKCAKNDAMFTTCTLACSVIIYLTDFFKCSSPTKAVLHFSFGRVDSMGSDLQSDSNVESILDDE